MTFFRVLSLLLLVVSLSACDSTEEFVIGGTYSGISNSQTAGAETTLSLTIPETASGSSFSFTAARTQFDETAEFSGTGTYDHPAVTITVAGETIEGTASDDGAALTLDDDTGLGSFTLTRE